MRERVRWLAIASAMATILGCSNEQAASTSGVTYASSGSPSVDAKGELSARDAAPAAAPSRAEATANAASTPTNAATPPARKIIYNAQVTIVVESITSTESQIEQLVRATGGYLSEKEVTTFLPQRRTATWKVRVPVDKFDRFLADVLRLGELTRNHVDSQDVTQEYYDLEARIKNKQEEEKRLVKHLADSTGKLEDILAVEREISRVRGEIEQSQGRLRYLANLTTLSTVTITATEEKDYTPPVTASFGTQIGRTFHDSFHGLIEFGKGIVLVVVALTPWLPLIAIALSLPVWLWRRASMRRRTHAV